MEHQGLSWGHEGVAKETRGDQGPREVFQATRKRGVAQREGASRVQVPVLVPEKSTTNMVIRNTQPL